jgi:metacaspase-1
MASVLEQAQKLIPAEVRMFSGCRDEQTSADVSNVSTFQLPDPAGRAGGALTSSMLKVLYADHKNTGKDLSFQEVLLQVRGVLKQGQYDQIPQLSSSRPVDIHTTFDVVPSASEGATRRALLIGINYVGHKQGVLSGCHNDALNMVQYIKDVHAFKDEDIVILLDDGQHTSPTKANILKAYKDLVTASKAGDAVFCHYSGHGGKVRWQRDDMRDA